MRIATAALLALAPLLACAQSGGEVDAGAHDAGHDAGLDAGGDAGAHDAGSDAGADAGDADAGADAGGALLSGVLMAGPGPAPGPYAGVHYVAGAASGDTDASGAFQYPAGAQITFSVGGLSLGTVAGAARITPFTLSGSCAITPQLTALLVFLQSLDADGDPGNGVALPHFSAQLTGALATASRSQLAADIATLAPGTTPVADQAALDQFIAQVDGEAWAQQSFDTFSTVESAIRSQGAATDGTGWWFSWRFGLERTDLSYATQVKNLSEIPAALVLAGSDHIGDIDIANGTIYAGIEDSAHYAHPYIGLFDAQSLNYQSSYPLDVSVQIGGVPWVAYDGVKHRAFSSPWSPSTTINIYDGSNGMALLQALPLSPALNRIQGAKLYRGFLYAAEDLTLKTIAKINLDTGTALPVLEMDLGSVEQEGLAFLERGDGTAMHTLNANAGSTAIELRHHQRTRAPLRDSICPLP